MSQQHQQTHQQQPHSSATNRSSAAAGAPPNTVSDDPPKHADAPHFDSGFLSSASIEQSFTASGELSGPPSAADPGQSALAPAIAKPPHSISACPDSGLCDDDGEEGAKGMHVDKPNAASEWSCDAATLHQQQPSNNLSRPGVRLQQQLQNPTVLLKYCYEQDENGDTQLHLSILSKKAKAIVNIIRLAPHSCLLDLRNDDGQSGMHYAVLTRQPHVIQQLRAAGAKASLRDHCGNTPLHLACINNDLGCVQALTNPIGVDELRMFPYAERIPLLPADTELVNYDGEYCVHIAAQRGHLDILGHLVHVCKADPNVREGRAGYTALHIACENRNAALRDFLLHECRGRLQLETCTYGRLTAHQLAAMLDDGRATDALRRAGAKPLQPLSDDEDDDDDSDDDLTYAFADAGAMAASPLAVQ